ncbi:MAG: restriction endonuclease subunit S [Gemmatimonadetes bacterium]|nr:restriction endonuclease subunit S [Gemmatimonadota bacterium]MYE92067.1 restriction endonuclease subunit S [Gemmatimonadota bacterium]MYJ10528.1 restriction endonuclease subunit S [Gemmatimonadota bacterium]
MTALQSYPAYQDSGLNWLGEVPEHWELRRGKTVLRCIDERSKTGSEELLTVSSDRGIVPRDSASVTMFKAQSYVGHKLCWPGDLVINSLWAWSRGLGVSRYHGIVSTAYGVYRVRRKARALPDFIHSLVRSEAFNWELRVRSKGIWISRLQLTDDSFLRAPLPLPPLSEQRAIVRFLDDADRRIRRYIRAKERLIELLEEERRATIHEAVTGRIDARTGQPYPAYRDSGVEWLGDVPEHWEVRRLKTLCDMRSGDTITAMSINEVGEYRVFGGNGIRGYSSRYTHDGDYVLIGRQGALCGNVHIVRGRFWASEHAVVATLHCGHVLNWFGAALETMNLNQYSIAAAQPGLSVDRVLHLWVPVPPAHEQRGIARFLAAAGRRLSARRGTLARQIDLLREYRTRLIADVVTGKLDVREAAAKLPETHPLAGDRERPGTIPTEPNPHASDYDMAKEASA